jgi:hypothetical protein
MERDKIIKLITEDIKHNQLLNGLDNIGLRDDDRYTLSIDLLVADMMGHPETKVPDKWLEAYHQTMLSIPFNIPEEEAHRRAVILFAVLSTL